MFVNGILVIYHHPLVPSANTILDHVRAFGHYSQFKVWTLNTELGFPEALGNLEFQGILLHYSLFGPTYMLNDEFLNYLERSRSSYKIAFSRTSIVFVGRGSASLIDSRSLVCTR